MSAFERILAGLRAVVLIEAEVRRLTEELRALDTRERETRERLIYLEGIIDGARRRADQRRLEKR